MKREDFARICLLVSLIGLSIMYASGEFLEPEKTDIGDISESDVGDTLVVEGTVSGFYSTDSASFFTLEDDSGSISVTDFDSRKFDNGEKINISGQVDLYQGDLQIVASEIREDSVT